MNYLTNYYKNLCENLQQKINYLEKIISEGQEMEFEEGGVIPSSEEDNNEDETKNSDPRAMKLGKGAVIGPSKVKGLGETKKSENSSY
jgi:hypothetical protein